MAHVIEKIKQANEYFLRYFGQYGNASLAVAEKSFHRFCFQAKEANNVRADASKYIRQTRRYFQSVELAWFADRAKWEGLHSAGLVEGIREIKGQRTVERRYYLSSLPLGVETFARAVRGHWGIENKLHWTLDVCFGEDQSRARTGHAAENLASLRRLALNLLKREKTKKRGVRSKMLNASWDHSYLLTLLGVEPMEN